MKYVPIPKPNDCTRADAKEYQKIRIERGESLEVMAARIGVTSEELAKEEAGEGLIIDDDEDLWQLPNGNVVFGLISKKPK